MSLHVVPILEKVAGETTIGPSPTFSKLHVYKAIALLGERSLGRNALSQELGIGPGAIRTLIAKLKTADIIKIESNGCRLTKKGQTVREAMAKRIPVSKPVKAGRMSFSKFDHAVIVKNASTMIRSPIEQRDAAIVQGAKGATTIIFKNGKFALPGDTPDCEKDFPDEVWKTLRRELKPQNGDVIIVASGESVQKAEYGTLAAAWTLIS
jgi:DNA-binding transcriptional regulator LsrR (DeoR family)